MEVTPPVPQGLAVSWQGPPSPALCLLPLREEVSPLCQPGGTWCSPCATSSWPGLALCVEGLPAYTEDKDTHKVQILISFTNQADSFHPTLSGTFPVCLLINTEQLVCPSLEGHDNVTYASADRKARLLLNSQKHAALMGEVGSEPQQ